MTAIDPFFLVEPEQKNLSRFLEESVECPTDTLSTIADGVRVAKIGSLCEPILKKYCTKNVISVKEDEIKEALKLVWTRLKQRIEPTAALAVAGVLYHKPADSKNPLNSACQDVDDIVIYVSEFAGYREVNIDAAISLCPTPTPARRASPNHLTPNEMRRRFEKNRREKEDKKLLEEEEEDEEKEFEDEDEVFAQTNSGLMVCFSLKKF
uniref:PALP domain-containing protein n=1 Tax=Caenorhabditis japonica TaxID=281687 RepID=A0A8R1EGM7_CAEJA